MAIEARRGCGYRKVGGIYLVGEGPSVGCDRIPLVLSACEVCGSEIKFSRGFQWLNAYKFFGNHEFCVDDKTCPICYPPKDEKYGLLWVGEKYYTPRAFIDEAMKMGVSKRIASVPRELKLGHTRIVLAHISVPVGEEFKKAIFYSFIPQRVEKIITESQSKDKTFMEALVADGYVAIVVPDDDTDHMDVKEDDMDEKIRKLMGFEMTEPPEMDI